MHATTDVGGSFIAGALYSVRVAIRSTYAKKSFIFLYKWIIHILPVIFLFIGKHRNTIKNVELKASIILIPEINSGMKLIYFY